MRKVGFFALIFWAIVAFVYFQVMPGVEASRNGTEAPTYTDPQTKPLAGEPDYPIPANKKVPYWVINCPVNKDVIVAGDKILANLDADHIVQTLFVCMPKGSVKQPASYAIRMERYMDLGLPDGPRVHNGWVTLVLYDKSGVEFHYGAGLGMNNFTSIDMAPLEASAEKAFTSGGLAAAITTEIKGYDEMARANYQPYQPTKPVYGADITPRGNDWVDWIIKYYNFAVVAEIGLALLMLLMGLDTMDLMVWVAFLPLRLGLMFAGGSSSDNEGHSGSGGGGSKRGN